MPLPRAVVCTGAGAALGWAALLPALLGSALGAALGFALARFAFGGILRRALARRPRVDAVMRAIEAEGWRVIFPLRLASPVPGPVVNFACGLSHVGFGEYFAATVVGVLPQILLFVFLGRMGSATLASRSLFSLDGLLAAAGTALTILVSWRLRAAARRLSARKVAEAGPPG